MKNYIHLFLALRGFCDFHYYFMITFDDIFVILIHNHFIHIFLQNFLMLHFEFWELRFDVLMFGKQVYVVDSLEEVRPC